MTVSVVIPFLNPGRFLKEAVRSVCTQSYAEWELLLVDDGSTDASTEIAMAQARGRPDKIRYLSHLGRENHGVSASRNLGLSAARGEIVAFLDADDVWMPEKLERQLELMEAHPEAALVYGPALNWFSWLGDRTPVGLDFTQDIGFLSSQLVRPHKLVEMYLWNSDIVPSASAVMVRRQTALAVGGFEEAFRSAIYDDQVFYSKIAFHACVLVADEGHFKYRQHSESGCATASRTDLGRQVRLQFLKWLRGYMAQVGICDAAISDMIDRELMVLRREGGLRAATRTFARAAVPGQLRNWLRSRLASPGV